jgi:hypothetical protein
MKIGKDSGWCALAPPSYDSERVRKVVEVKVKNKIDVATVDWIEVLPTSRTVGSQMKTKNL